MKIALVGTRGIPAHYGGFETCAEELSKRLVKRGHEVWVYGRSGYYKIKRKEYLGIKLKYIPAFKIKILDTLSHTFLSLLHTLSKNFDIILVFNYGNSPLLILSEILCKHVLLHMDGLEWRREKWKGFGEKYYKFAEWLSTKLAVDLIVDSKSIKEYFKKKYGESTHFIPYGADLEFSRDRHILERFSLEPEDYFLQITRFEPENNPLLSIEAFQRLKTNKKLVLVGGVQYRSEYSEKIYSVRDPRVKLLGFIYDKKILRELFCNCYAYIHGNEVGGTNPALLQAMGAGCYIISRDVPFNREVLLDAGIYYNKDAYDLAAKLSWALRNGEEIKKKGEEARKIIKNHYTWDRVVDKYLEYFYSFSGHGEQSK